MPMTELGTGIPGTRGSLCSLDVVILVAVVRLGYFTSIDLSCLLVYKRTTSFFPEG